MARQRAHGHIARESAAFDSMADAHLCSVVVGAVAAVGAVGASAYAANKGAKAQGKAIDAQREAAAAQDEVSREQLALSREQFDWNKSIYERDVAPAEAANRELQKRLADDYLDTSSQQKRFAQEQRDEYKSIYLPVERRMVDESNNYDSEGNVSRRSGMAAANINQQFSNSAGQKARLTSRFGINPNSSAFAREAGKDARAQAVATAGAATGAAFDTKDKAIALRSGVANFGRNMPNTAASYFAGANSSNAAAGGASTSAVNSAMAAPQFMNNAYAGMNNAYSTNFGNVGAIGNRMSNAAMMDADRWNGISQGIGGLAGSAISGLGGWGAVGSTMSGLFSSGMGLNTAGPARG